MIAFWCGVNIRLCIGTNYVRAHTVFPEVVHDDIVELPDRVNRVRTHFDECGIQRGNPEGRVPLDGLISEQFRKALSRAPDAMLYRCMKGFLLRGQCY